MPEFEIDRITPARVREIVGMDEQPIVRNLLITDAYHQLTLQMCELFGRDEYCWPIFATWASKQAGAFIRREELPARLRALLDERGVFGDEARATAQAMLDGVARFVIGGNTIVFEELGDAFARFAEAFADPSARTPARLAELIARYPEGESLPDEVEVGPDGELRRTMAGGQSLVRSGLTHYFEALHTTDVDARSELLLLANVECGLHEQTRLQPYIAGAIDAPLATLLRLGGAEAAQEHALHDELVALIRRLATELMMTLALPGEVLRLGGDLPAPRGRALWPAELARLEHPELLQLAAAVGAYDTRERGLDWGDRVEGWILGLLARLGVGREEVQGSGARDWCSLFDRMRFIFEYFRSRQRDASLLEPPFSAAQRAEFLAGRTPAGPL